MTYFETEGLDVMLRFGGAARFFDRSKNELSFPNNEAVILVVMDGAYYGLHLPANTTVTKDGNNLTINSDFFTISVLPNAEALDAFMLMPLIFHGRLKCIGLLTQKIQL